MNFESTIKFNIEENDVKQFMSCEGIHYFGPLSGEYEFNGNVVDFCRFFCKNPYEIGENVPEFVNVSDWINENELQIIKKKFNVGNHPTFTREEANKQWENYIQYICTGKYQTDAYWSESNVFPCPGMEIFTFNGEKYDFFGLVKKLNT